MRILAVMLASVVALAGCGATAAPTPIVIYVTAPPATPTPVPTPSPTPPPSPTDDPHIADLARAQRDVQTLIDYVNVIGYPEDAASASLWLAMAEPVLAKIDTLGRDELRWLQSGTALSEAEHAAVFDALIAATTIADMRELIGGGGRLEVLALGVALAESLTTWQTSQIALR